MAGHGSGESWAAIALPGGGARGDCNYDITGVRRLEYYGDMMLEMSESGALFGSSF